MGLLRLLLAISVFGYHTGVESYGIFTPIAGVVAVFCFFVVSGFYMGMVLSEKYTKANMGDAWLRKFYLARYLRLWPLYMLAVIATFFAYFIGWVELSPKLMFASDDGIKGLCYSILLWFFNVSMLGLNILSTGDNIIAPSWTMGVELSFYLLAPWLVAYANKFQLAVLFVIGFALQFVNYGQHSPLLFGMHCFLMGIFAYRVSVWLKSKSIKYDSPALKVLLYLILFVLVFKSSPKDVFVLVDYSHAHSSLDKNVYPVILAMLLPVIHLAWNSSKFDFWLGQTSYPFYLFHQLFIDVLCVCFRIDFLSAFVSCIIFSYALVWLEIRYLEPFRRSYSR